VLNLLIAFVIFAIPAALLGERIEAVLFSPVPVAIALVVGGVIILWAERRKHSEHIRSVDEVRPVDALKVGLFQTLALFPGTSRSAATIIGGLLIGMSRRTATEFSFFIAIPSILAATVYSLWKARHAMTLTEGGPLAFSCVVSFISALLSIRFLLRFVSRHSFAVFAWYRIVFGGVILATWALGWVKW
jgi:undecaprenyl-diphosphatase